MLCNADTDEELHLLNDGKTRYTSGSCVSCLYHLKDIDGSHQGFFVFPDLSIRVEGRYRLKLCSSRPSPLGAPLQVCLFRSFHVYTAKRFPGMEESTKLSKSFAEQGLKVRVRKHPARAAEVPSAHKGRQRGIRPRGCVQPRSRSQPETCACLRHPSSAIACSAPTYGSEVDSHARLALRTPCVRPQSIQWHPFRQTHNRRRRIRTRFATRKRRCECGLLAAETLSLTTRSMRAIPATKGPWTRPLTMRDFADARYAEERVPRDRPPPALPSMPLRAPHEYPEYGRLSLLGTTADGLCHQHRSPQRRRRTIRIRRLQASDMPPHCRMRPHPRVRTANTCMHMARRSPGRTSLREGTTLMLHRGLCVGTGHRLLTNDETRR